MDLISDFSNSMKRATDASARIRGSASLAVWMASRVMLFVLLGSLALIWAFERRIEREERRAFEELARVNTSFLERSRLPLTAKMAVQLGEIICAEVFFIHERTGEVFGSNFKILPNDSFPTALDGNVNTRAKGLWIVGLPGPSETKVFFVRPASAHLHAMKRSDTWLALGVLWLLSLALGWGLARRVTGPLASMAKSLPLVGTEQALPELPVQRHDEIGKLAQTLTRTHQSLRDERERRRAAERHALLGRMAASLAHEVRNPVAAIRLHAQLLEHASPEEAAVSRPLIESEAGRIEELVSQWLNHAKPAPPILSEVGVLESLRQAVQLIELQARHAGAIIEMVTDFSPSLRIPADRHRLQQVFGNLLRNAVQAMPSGGSITVRVLDEKTHVAVTVEDGGQGFSPLALARSGEAFFSEKEGGMGLGLAVAREICLAHGGSLVVENRTDGGAKVTVRFSKNPPLPEQSPTTLALP